jgi:hypothetical protein
MKKTILYFNKEDEGLQNIAQASVSWREDTPIDIPEISIRGLGKWRHFPSNMLAVNSRAIDMLKLGTKGQRLSKIGISYVGLEAKTDIMLSKNLREGRNGTKKTIEFLRKFFVKGLNASSLTVTLSKPEAEN